MPRIVHDFDDDTVQLMLDFVELLLDGRDDKAESIASGLTTRMAAHWWSVLNEITEVVAEQIEPYGPE